MRGLFFRFNSIQIRFIFLLRRNPGRSVTSGAAAFVSPPIGPPVGRENLIRILKDQEKGKAPLN